MLADTLLAPPREVPRAGAGTRLAVTWPHPVDRGHHAVGLLSWDGARFEFRYLARAEQVKDFRPFLGFGDLRQVYTSDRLFPLFAQRVMRPARPDLARHLHALVLTDSASPWEILGRSQGQRQGDGIRVFAEPSVDPDGRTSSTFFVNGVRHRLGTDASVEGALAGLVLGQHLRLVAEPDNPVDANALLVSEDAGVALGLVPSVLLDYVHAVREHGEPGVVVEWTNGTDVPPAYRLLVRLDGRVEPDYQPFAGPMWAPAA